MGKVARPNGRLPLADVKIDRDVDIVSGHMLGDRGFIIAVDDLAALGDRYAADGNAQPVAVRLFAGLDANA